MDRSIAVDAHHHVWELAVRDQPWTTGLAAIHRSFSLEDLTPALLACDVRSTIVVQTLNVVDETPELLDLARRSPVVAGVVGWVDLVGAGVGDDVARLRARPGGEYLKGVRHVAQGEDERWFARPDVLDGLRQVEATGLTYDILVHHQQLPAAIEAVAARPGLRFVLDHFGKPPIKSGELEPWKTNMLQLARHENVAVKFSGLVTEADHSTWRVSDLAPFVDVVLSAFGAGRVMFGSDWPVCLVAASYAEVVDSAEQLTSGLSSAERSALFGGTASAWYGLAGR